MRLQWRPIVCTAVLALACAAGTGAVPTDAWPDFRAPADASVETIAADMLLDGKPCRMVRFEAHASDDEVVAFYRSEFGPKHVENRVTTDRVIATRQGDYFVTVRLHALDDQTTQGTVMTTLIAGSPVASAVLVDTKKLLPVDTQVMSSVQTNDDAKRSVLVIGINRNSLRANRDHVIDAMAERGFRLTTQGDSQDGSSRAPPRESDAASLSLQLASASEEASVTISDAGPYRSVVINRIREAK